MATTRRSAATSTTPTSTGRGATARAERRERSVSSSRPATFTLPGLDRSTGSRIAAELQERLAALVGLSLTVKHIHWNVVGPNFVGVHEMLDPQYAGILPMIDALAERIAALGGVPVGVAGRLGAYDQWSEYTLDRADSMTHLGALDVLYTRVIEEHRRAMDDVADADRVTEDLLIGQVASLEKYQWFVRSHLADWAGGMANAGSSTAVEAAAAVAAKTSRRSPEVRRRAAS